MKDRIRLLDVVALTEPVAEEGLRRGQVGTVVELLPPDAYLVEFSDSSGRAYAMLSAKAEQLLVLHYKPKAAPRDHTLRRRGRRAQHHRRDHDGVASARSRNCLPQRR